MRRAMLLVCVSSLLAAAVAQDVVTFDVNARQQILKDLKTHSEVHMYHSAMSPGVNDLVNVVRASCYAMSLKQDVESVNDNSDPYVTDFSTIDPARGFIGGNGGMPMADYFPFLRDCKRVSDSLRQTDPSLRPFTLHLMGGVGDRFVPSWLKTTAAGTSQIDSTRYAEFAEHIYAQIKLYKDSTGLDVSSICPLTIGPLGNGNWITPSNLCKLMDTIGTYLEARGLRPELTYGYGTFVSFDPANRPRFLEYIHAVFNDPLARRYVKAVIAEQSYNSGNSLDDAFCTAMADSARKYGFDVTLDYMNQGGHSNTWAWNNYGLPFAGDLPRMLNMLRSSNLMLYYHANFEVGLSVSMVFDTMPNGDLNDPQRLEKRLKTEAFYTLSHLYGHLHPGATYVVTSSSSNASVRQAVIYDTTNGKTTVLLTNTSSSARTVSLNCGSYDPGTYQAFRLSSTEVNVRLSPVTSLSSITLPPQSATFLTNGYVSGDIVQARPRPLTVRAAVRDAQAAQVFDLMGRSVGARAGAPAGVRVCVPAGDSQTSRPALRVER